MSKTKFTIGDLVRRDPNTWRYEDAVFRVQDIDDGLYFVVRLGRDGKVASRPDPMWPGRVIYEKAMPYLPIELVHAIPGREDAGATDDSYADPY